MAGARMRHGALALAAAAAAALVGSSAESPRAEVTAKRPPGAAVWVSTSGNDSSCKRLRRSKPCASFDRAYRLARAGDHVEVAAGTYGHQTIGVDPSKTSSVDVVFRPARGAKVTLGCDGDVNCIAVKGKHVTVRSMRTAVLPPLGGKPRQGGVCICRGSDDVTFANLDSGHVFIAGDNARVIGGDYGPAVDEVSKIEYGVGRPPRNILISGARFHDHLGHDRHSECWAVYAGENITMRSNRLDNCETFGIFIAPGDDTISNVLIENNFFSNTASVDMSAHIKTRNDGTCNNVLVRHNTFVHDNVISECRGSNTRWESNIFESGGCEPVGTMDYNVSRRGRCGPHDVVVRDLGLVDPGRGDLHLRPGSPARGKGNPAGGPGRDIDGQRRPRPRGSRPDAGADERT